ncbi:hypothetical protein K7432_001397 [Basidiobolus ranarum]|uniref:LITAF domain-containing protein n=1 Tax=Basidiobolus ranarum TaxID=34480 RepID=A0ABR2W9P8_9FUNG
MYAHNSNPNYICNSTPYKVAPTVNYFSYEDIEETPSEFSIQSPTNSTSRSTENIEESTTCSIETPLANLTPAPPIQSEENEIPPPYVIDNNEEGRLSYEVVDHERRPTEFEIVALPSHAPIVAFCPHCQASVEVYTKVKSTFSQKFTTMVRKLFRSRRPTSCINPRNVQSMKYLCKTCHRDMHMY